eukprot:3491398-Alexandrium_andersonii.AAC.1
MGQGKDRRRYKGLHTEGRPSLLAEAYASSGADLVGLQETRLPEGGISKLGEYWHICAPPDQRGCGGCSLLCRAAPRDGPPHFAKDDVV